MIGRPVATYPRREQRGAPAPFVVTHGPNTHAPWGVHRVYTRDRGIGRQLSRPSLDDCERMLRPEPPRELPITSYTELTKARQARTAAQARAERQRHAGEPDDTRCHLHLPHMEGVA